MGLAILLTRLDPFRFDRFAKIIIGADVTDEEKEELRAQMDKVLAQGKSLADLDGEVASRSLVEGFGRLDALNRIGNEVFSVDLHVPGNYAATSAPVHFPRIWDASWYDWVQYNGSIEQPAVRNVGEALGVSAWVNLTDARSGLFNSSVKVENTFEMEQLLAGQPQPQEKRKFNGLNSPKWPKNILGPTDDKLAAEGATLYKRHCEPCHLPPADSPEFWASPNWLPPNAAGDRLLKARLEDVGTDLSAAIDMFDRKLKIPSELNIKSECFDGARYSYGCALGDLVEKIVNRWYDNQTPPTAPAIREQMNGNRKNGIQAPLKYKAIPLRGIWATPPYLHNGSVPTLYALLLPVGERPKTFYLGHREYDPKDVDYNYKERLDGGFKMDTAIRGNSNAGHEFKDGPLGNGTIGPSLNEEQRRALVEFLKTL